MNDRVQQLLVTRDGARLAAELGHALSTCPVMLTQLGAAVVEGLAIPVDGTPLVEVLSEEFLLLSEGPTRLELCAVEGTGQRNMRLYLFGPKQPRFSLTMEALEYNPIVCAVALRLWEQGQYGDDDNPPLMAHCVITPDSTTGLVSRFAHEKTFAASLVRGALTGTVLATYSAYVRYGAAKEESGSHFIQVTRQVLESALLRALDRAQTANGRRVLRELAEVCGSEARFSTHNLMSFVTNEMHTK